MKKITKPEQKEEATYYSDFSGKCFGEWSPPIELKIKFGYGSKYDGSSLNFHLDDKDIEDVLFLLKKKINNETKKSFKDIHLKLDNHYEDSVEMRDWTSCDYICNEKGLLERLI
jgi:hypothetical protein